MSVSNGQKESDTSNRPYIDYTNKDYNSLRDALLAITREKFPGWTDHSANDPGVMLLELFAYMGDLILYYQDRIANGVSGFRSGTRQCYQPAAPDQVLNCVGSQASVDLILLFKPDIETDAHIVTIDDKAEFKTTTGLAEVTRSFSGMCGNR